MKIVILFMQKNKFLGKYCFYGCWCFPRGSGNNGGFGQPVDNIDKSCREYSTCYNCIYNQNIGSQRCPENTADRYQIGGFVDRFGQVQIFCTDPWGTCNRSRCECDRKGAFFGKTISWNLILLNGEYFVLFSFDIIIICLLIIILLRKFRSISIRSLKY